MQLTREQFQADIKWTVSRHDNQKQVNLHFSRQEQKLSGFLTKTPQDIRKRCFKLEKNRKGRKSKTFSTFFEDFFLPISVAYIYSASQDAAVRKKVANELKCLAFPAF